MASRWIKQSRDENCCSGTGCGLCRPVLVRLPEPPDEFAPPSDAERAAREGDRRRAQEIKARVRARLAGVPA